MAARWSNMQSVGMFLGWIRMMFWFGRCGVQMLKLGCLWLTGMYVFDSIVGLIGERASQGTRVDLSMVMLQLQLLRVRVYVQEGGLGDLDIKVWHGQQIKSRKATILVTAVIKKASPMLNDKAWHVMEGFVWSGADHRH